MNLETSANPQWYAIHTKPSAEETAVSYLSRLGLEVFFPQTLRSGLRGKQPHKLRSLFPGYLFARFCPSSHFHAVRYARGVRQVVSAGNAPLPVDAAIVELIRERTLTDLDSEDRTARICSGTEVMIHEGRFQGLGGVFERAMSDGERVLLLLETIHHQARVWVHSACLCSRA